MDMFIHRYIYTYLTICLMDMYSYIYLSDEYAYVVITTHLLVYIWTSIWVSIHWVRPHLQLYPHLCFTNFIQQSKLPWLPPNTLWKILYTNQEWQMARMSWNSGGLSGLRLWAAFSGIFFLYLWRYRSCLQIISCMN